MRRIRRFLQLAALAIVTLSLALILFIQIHQHLLRHRAEALHADILALRLHPGTFADIQRLQHRWGAHAHYDGSCTPHHCIYNITLTDLSQPFAFPSRWYIRPWMYRPYEMLGGRHARVGHGSCPR